MNATVAAKAPTTPVHPYSTPSIFWAGATSLWPAAASPGKKGCWSTGRRAGQPGRGRCRSGGGATSGVPGRPRREARDGAPPRTRTGWVAGRH